MTGLALTSPAVADAPARAAVRRLTLTAFRGYRAARIESDGRPVVLTGPNGAGKTNLLEALSYLGPGRGLRGARLKEVDCRAGGGPWAVAAEIETLRGTIAIGTGRAPVGETEDGRDRRVVKIDGQAAGPASLADCCQMIWVAPDMDRLFLDGASGRRRFLDRLVYGTDPGHAARVAAYDHALRERSRLLRAGERDDSWLGALEATMAEHGVAIAAARREAVARLDAALRTHDGPFPRAGLRLSGLAETLLDTASALETEDALKAAFRESRPRDAEAGGAADGPHRSDLLVIHAAKDMPAAQCSTGEQKALLMTIVLAHARLVSLDRHETPILLLDEVAAHLDDTRRRALFEEILRLGAQAWLTGTDAALFAPLGDNAQAFAVADAVLAPARLEG